MMKKLHSSLKLDQNVQNDKNQRLEQPHASLNTYSSINHSCIRIWMNRHGLSRAASWLCNAHFFRVEMYYNTTASAYHSKWSIRNTPQLMLKERNERIVKAMQKRMYQYITLTAMILRKLMMKPHQLQLLKW